MVVSKTLSEGCRNGFFTALTSKSAMSSTPVHVTPHEALTILFFFEQEANLETRGRSCLVQNADLGDLKLNLKQNLEVF